jgi:hypothetical protein
LVIFKFLPDLGTALIQHSTSALTSFAEFEDYFMTAGSVRYPRFLGTQIIYHLAKMLALFVQSNDLRLHPLRIAVGIVTPVYAIIGVLPALRPWQPLSWRYFLVPYLVAVLIGQYVFYPSDMPAFAFLSVALYSILQQRLLAALAFTLVTGLFRETSLHAVFFVFVWALCSQAYSARKRIAWVACFAAAFVLQYIATRHYFPGPVSAAGGLILNPRRLFLERGMLSLTTIFSLGLALIFPAGCLLRLQYFAPDSWEKRFFRLNCFAVPLWVVFYRVLDGNISEFRLLLPVLLPCIYGISYVRDSTRIKSETT